MKHEFKCSVCGLDKVHISESTTGYALNDKDEKICFDCCGNQDAEKLKNLGSKEKICLYLDGLYIINWPGTLKIKITAGKNGSHNIARSRYDAWFSYAGNNYHGIQYGDNTQIIHIKKTA